MTPVCPFVKAPRPNDASSMKSVETLIATNSNKQQQEVEAKCPFGYDSKTFKIGPLSCMICQALLFQSSKCQPCSHSFCKECISRFKDCPLCGADIEKIEEDENLQSLVDRFIDGHAIIKRTHVDDNAVDKVKAETNKKVIYEDVSLDRGAFLVQQAMRAFRA